MPTITIKNTLYGYRWQKARSNYLSVNHLCVSCNQPAVVVDHITPHKGNMELFWSVDNWQPMCKSCHDSKTATEDGGFGNKASTKPKPGCTVDGLPIDTKHHWNR